MGHSSVTLRTSHLTGAHPPWRRTVFRHSRSLISYSKQAVLSIGTFVLPHGGGPLGSHWSLPVVTRASSHHPGLPQDMTRIFDRELLPPAGWRTPADTVRRDDASAEGRARSCAGAGQSPCSARASHPGQGGQAVSRRARSAGTASTMGTASPRAPWHAARSNTVQESASSRARSRYCPDGAASRRLARRHSLGKLPPLEPLVEHSASVPHVRCYAHPPQLQRAPFLACPICVTPKRFWIRCFIGSLMSDVPPRLQHNTRPVGSIEKHSASGTAILSGRLWVALFLWVALLMITRSRNTVHSYNSWYTSTKQFVPGKNSEDTRAAPQRLETLRRARHRVEYAQCRHIRLVCTICSNGWLPCIEQWTGDGQAQRARSCLSIGRGFPVKRPCQVTDRPHKTPSCVRARGC